ncbi:exodeoxyribonuclease VII large subunit [Paracoccus denitrificans]|jgi:exodeoxyribonuclease VII large subunit|uniref:Exodeoxyribonuclease 7 large subunit n=1 Tax=Paracoccus denitrificans (strain Pd 1222) TaxID=318586 RepID=A1B9A0_PARDP|nr:exodeoxyribonuclease VII large subunit [Paracoccus denitrificans]ABL72094.1 Exodeoxyribonuclease VII large subunit [Paracoccus denitrificans PD1222]MCU7426845.1 exodeoxyribonuclease VII large subunit [Paracoccus denitrificans]QAR29192.1 exodeoxyribonuclease VII large subunit [Paracoccus denitrificans]UPV98143.1 exodeoxyribonuclease VII large subunit [Paracoccus denitrificans]WQO36546.1 exodeoxyribonuclease VII large subunit [Paracoccus denitrificans]
MELFEDTPASNAHEFTVSEISGAVKRVLEGEFGRVRVRGEIGRVSRPSSGHLYFDLKDDRAVIAAVTWKGQAARLSTRPEEGIEVIATGRLTTFPGQSKYQLIVEEIEPAGAGALMMMLEKCRKALAAEGLFDESRKRPLPYLPRVIGVVTSPSGAVIRDILHRLRDRFPTHVLIWPVAVQGEGCASQVTAAIRGFNALPSDGPLPRPDLIIVARGGGSLEDLWGFNEEAVVRAAADSLIPLISAVGHETDTTLIDFASDRRAPTPTAAAEMAVPVRAELAARLTEIQARMMRAAQTRNQRQRQRLSDLGRALGRPQALTAPARQRFDLFAERLEPALRGFVRARRDRLNALPLSLSALRAMLRNRRDALQAQAQRLPLCLARLGQRRSERLTDLGSRLERARARMLADAARQIVRDRGTLDRLAARLSAAGGRLLAPRRDALERLDRLRQTLGYRETLRRGFAVVHGPSGLLTHAAEAAQTPRFEIEFLDGRMAARPDAPPAKPARKPREPKGQKSLF